MSADESMPEASLEQVERALRPLRRVLARRAVERAADAGAFLRGCARLAEPLRALSLPEAVAEDVGVVLQALDPQAEAVNHALATAWQAVLRLDERLGLPAPLPKPRRRAEVVAVVEDEPAPKAEAGRQADEPSGGETGSSRRSRRGRKKERRGSKEVRGARRSAKAEPVAAPPPAPPSDPSPRRWDASLTDLDLPEADADRLSDAGFEEVADLLLGVPEVTACLSPIHGAGRELPDGEIAVGGRVHVRWTVCRPSSDGGQVVLSHHVRLHGAGTQDVLWATSVGVDPQLARGERVVVGGTSEGGAVTGGHLLVGHQGQARALRRHEDPEIDAIAASTIARLLPRVGDLDEPVPGDVLSRRHLVKLEEVVARLATRGADDPVALRRLAFDQVLGLQLARAWSRFESGSGVRGIPHGIGHRAVVQLELDGRLALPDTASAVALEAIKRDLRDTRPMRRVVSGDDLVRIDDVVLRTLLLVADSKAQVLIVAPDLPSLIVLRDRLSPMLDAAGLAHDLHDGSLGPARLEALRKGDTLVLFGTAATLTQAPAYRRLGLVLAFEQTEHGALGPLAARGHKPAPDVLTVVRGVLPSPVRWSAWPMADLTTLSQQTPGPRATRWEEPMRQEAYRAQAQDVGEGLMALVAFPMRRGGADLLGRREVEEFAARIGDEVFGRKTLGVLHGAMTPGERARAWEDVVQGRVAGLVSTLPVELLPALERPMSVLVEHADRMDLARVLGLRALASTRGRMHLITGSEPSEGALRAIEALTDRKPDEDVAAAHPEAWTLVGEAEGSTWPEALREVPGDVREMAREEAHALLREGVTGSATQDARVLSWARRQWAQIFGADVPCPIPEIRGSGGPARRKRRRRRRR